MTLLNLRLSAGLETTSPNLSGPLDCRFHGFSLRYTSLCISADISSEGKSLRSRGGIVRASHRSSNGEHAMFTRTQSVWLSYDVRADPLVHSRKMLNA